MGPIRTFTIFRIIACLLYHWSPSSIQGVAVSYLQVDDTLVIEKVYVQTDRTCYYPDDDIWYKAYLVEAPYNLLSNHSCNLHVELISPGSEIIQSRVIKLDKGLGTGDFHLPENLASGHYLLRAYTNYMRNFGDQLFFTKEILVVNSTDKKAEMDTVDIENKIEITFFPEGGSLIDNVSSVVAFKATNGLGKGCDIIGTVYSSNGDSVTSFCSSHLGMGSFNLKPRPGIKYSAIVSNTEGLKIKTNLPQSFSKGINLSVSEDKNAGFLFTVRTNAATFASMKDEDLILTLSSSKTILKTVHFKIKSLVNTFPLTTEDLPYGVLVATLYGSDTLPFAERLFFHRDADNISINIKTDKTEYKPRDSVSMSVSLLSESGTSRRAYVSLSAAEALLHDDSEYPSSIASWFLLESDIRGQVEEPSRYFDSSNPEHLKELDLLLLTQGWRDFRWKYNKMDYPAEEGFVVSGRIRKTLSNKPPENSKVHIGIFQDKRNILMTIMTDESGNFRTQGIDLNGEARLVVTSLGNKDKMKGILILDSLKYEPPVNKYAWRPFTLKKERLSLLKEEDAHIKTVKKQFRLSDTISLDNVTITGRRKLSPQEIKINDSRIYGSPDREIIITPELKGYNNAIELLRGRVAGLTISGNPPQYRINIHGIGSMNSGTSPLIIIDGIYPRDVSEASSIPLSLIDRIDVLKPGPSSALFGLWGTGGVISIITKTGAELEYVPVSYSANIMISGYDSSRVFYSPKHLPGSDPKYNPDLRTTLYWHPDISLQNNKPQVLNYFNADNSAKIRVIAEGITEDGIPVTCRAEYEVR